MSNTVLRGTIKILGPLPDGTGNKFLTVNTTTGAVGQVDSPLSSVTGDISINGAGVSSINAGVIVNADINGSAAIAHSKMAALATNRVMITDSSGFAATSFTTTILNYSATLTSDAQAQINAKQGTITGAASTVVSANLTANMAVVSGAGGKIEAHPTTTLTEIGYVTGVINPIQTQLNARLSVTLAGVAQGDIIYFNGANWVNLPRGTNGQFLSSTAATIQWASFSTFGVPTGGTAGQALTKINGTDYNTQWTTITLATIGVTASIAEVDLLIGAGGNIQSQLNNKLSSALATDNLWVGVAGVATPTTNLPTGTTIGSAVIYRVGGTDVTPADGGTGISSYAVGDILYASGATTLSKLADVATGNSLISGGVTTAPAWGKIGLTTHISGTLAVGNGGTGLTTIAARSIFVANALDTFVALTPAAGQSIRINAGNTAWEAYTPGGGGIGGSTGSVDNAMLRADGTGGATVQASSVIVDDSANIVLGTSSLSGSRLISAVNSTTNAALSFNAQSQFVFERSTGASADFGLLNLQFGQNRYSNTASDSGYMQMARFRGTTSGSGTIINNGDTLGQLKFAGYDGATGPMNGAIIKGISNGTVASGSVPTDLLFMTGSGGASDVNTIERLRLTSDGRFYGTALHNNAGAVTGATNQYIASGTYTPTLTNVTNVAASTAYVCQWIRVGNVVVVSGKVDIDATLAASTATELGISLPIASALAAEEQLGGDAVSDSVASLSARIRADATNDRAAVVFKAISLTNDSYSFQFTYLIL